MSQADRKARIREYKETPPLAGVYRIRNTAIGKSLLGATVNPQGRLNRYRFQLGNGSHPHAQLQADWRELGPGAFEFTVLDRLEPRDEPSYDPEEDLEALRQMWADRLVASGETLYSRSGGQ